MMTELTAQTLEPGDRLRDVEGHDIANPWGPDVTNEIAVKKRWRGDSWLFGVVLENGRIGNGGSKSFALSCEEINSRLETGRYQTVDCEVNRTLNFDTLPIDPDDDVYIRFGDIPDSERSYNSTDDCYEAGVSVYAADVKSVPAGSDPAGMFDPHGPKALQVILLARRDTYLVTGDEVGTGVDGEPLLRDVETIAELELGDEASGWVIVEE